LPHEVVDVADVLLVRFGSKHRLEQPPAIFYLSNVANFSLCGDAPAHDNSLLLSVQNLADRDGAGGTGVNDALVVLDRDEEPLLIEYRPKFADETVDLILEVHRQVGQIEGLAHNWLVDVRDEGGVEAWINGTIKVWSWVSELPQNDSSLDVVKEFIVDVRLIRESAVVEEWILHLFPALVSRGDTDR
jgi:hypothetical protein